LPPTDWPDPPLLNRLLLENPWPLAIAFAAVAVVMFLVAGRRDDHRLRNLAAVPAGLAVGVIALGGMVTTEREQLEARTRALAEAVAEPFDLDAVRELTTEDARLLKWNREQMIAIARHAADRVTIDGYTVTNLMAHPESDRYGRTYIAAFGRAESSRRGGGRFKTSWMLRWRRGDDGAWRLSEVEDVEVNNRSAERILASLLN
jgi:hypothetical protein